MKVRLILIPIRHFYRQNLDLTVIRYGSFGELIVDSIKLPQLRETVALKD